MPTITVPKDITITVEGMKDPLTFTFVDGFIVKTILADQQWGANTEQLFAAMEIRTAFKGASPGSRVTLSQDQWSKLTAVVKQPSNPYNPTVMIEGRTFLEAVFSPDKD